MHSLDISLYQGLINTLNRDKILLGKEYKSNKKQVLHTHKQQKEYQGTFEDVSELVKKKLLQFWTEKRTKIQHTIEDYKNIYLINSLVLYILK